MKITNASLIKEFAQPGFCEWCGRSCVKREGHHLRTRNPEITVRINLIALGSSRYKGYALCPCHRSIHDGKISRASILERVAIREGVTVELIEEVMNFFQRVIRPTSVQLERSLFELGPSAYFLAERELREAGILP
jgi:hypothetical protein